MFTCNTFEMIDRLVNWQIYIIKIEYLYPSGQNRQKKQSEVVRFC